ncbi:MAG: (2Fe-2S)-binding protein [Emergencia sp.]|nr:(2Fe-2S)-binding protein [Emergencia sp.]
MDKQSRDYEVCLCYKTTRGEVEDIIREKKITSLKELCETAEIGNKCGGCREDLEMILNQVLEEE